MELELTQWHESSVKLLFHHHSKRGYEGASDSSQKFTHQALLMWTGGKIIFREKLICEASYVTVMKESMIPILGLS